MPLNIAILSLIFVVLSSNSQLLRTKSRLTLNILGSDKNFGIKQDRRMNNNQIKFNALILNKTLNISDTRYPEFRYNHAFPHLLPAQSNALEAQSE